MGRKFGGATLCRISGEPMSLGIRARRRQSRSHGHAVLMAIVTARQTWSASYYSPSDPEQAGKAAESAEP